MIIMLCNIKEKGRTKCAKYWPSRKLDLPNKSVEFISEEKSDNLIIRKFNLKDQNSTREITQLHFISWPDHGVPEIDQVYEDFTLMLKKVDEVNSPIIIHCSAGIGRTGTFISFYNIYKSLQSESSLSIFNIVRKLKEQRLGLVENILQYKLIYSFLDKYVKKLI